jgi:23S rRNA pseudouridine2457 synthase
MTLLVFNKPYGVLCQFTGSGERPTLADYIPVPGVYPAGRLDQDSEGLLLLTDDGVLQARITDPKSQLWKRYLAQVERVPDEAALASLCAGVMIENQRTRPARARLVNEPATLWPRDPPIRQRKNVPTAWLELEIHEGRNRQVRKMTAAIGHPTLRLLRTAIGSIVLGDLSPGQWRELDAAEIDSLVSRESVSRSPPPRRHPHTATRPDGRSRRRS